MKMNKYKKYINLILLYNIIIVYILNICINLIVFI